MLSEHSACLLKSERCPPTLCSLVQEAAVMQHSAKVPEEEKAKEY